MPPIGNSYLMIKGVIRTVSFIFLMIGTVGAFCQTPPSTIGKQPNIIFVITDSHRADALGANGNKFIETPYLDAIASQGLNFRQAYVTTAICAVSRASILSGQYQQRHRINDFKTNFSEEAWSNTYPMLLRKGGYQVAQIGFLGVGNNPPAHTFDHWDVKIPWMSEDSVHQTDAITEKAVEYIKQQAENNKPFYLAVSFNAAHEIDPKNGVPAHYLIQPRYSDLYQDLFIPAPPSSTNKHWQEFPDFFKNEKNIARERWQGFLSSPELFERNTKDYYRLITGLDEAVGEIIDAAQKYAPNTVFIYTSDHGFSLGEHGLMGKWYGFQKGIHVPLIFYDLRPQGVVPMGVSDDLVLNIDLAPTILGIAGITAPASMQGMDLIKNFGNKEMRRNSFFYEHTVFPSPLLPKMEGVVSKDYKYLIFTEHDYELFYDLKSDPHEMKNLISSRRYRKKIDQFRQQYQAFKETLP